MANYLANYLARFSLLTESLSLILQYAISSNKTVSSLGIKVIVQLFYRWKKHITREPGPILSNYKKWLRSSCDIRGYVNDRCLKATDTNRGKLCPDQKGAFCCLFGFKPFCVYMYSSKVIVESDHQPLESILQKQTETVQTHLILQLQQYDIERNTIPKASAWLTTRTKWTSGWAGHCGNKLVEMKTVPTEDLQLTPLKWIFQSGWRKWKEEMPPSLPTRASEMKSFSVMACY